jgi:DNA-directed RNA polymerase specialized sigma24 family protein
MGDRDDLGQRTVKLLAEQLPGVDLADADADDITVAIIHFAQQRSTLQIVAGRLIAELNRRGMSFREIAALTGLPKSTVDRWAAPFKTQVRP